MADGDLPACSQRGYNFEVDNEVLLEFFPSSIVCCGAAELQTLPMKRKSCHVGVSFLGSGRIQWY